MEHHIGVRKERLNKLHLAAAEELVSSTAHGNCFAACIDANIWLDWFWNAGADAEKLVTEISARLPLLCEFLCDVTANQWTYNSAVVATPTQNESNTRIETANNQASAAAPADKDKNTASAASKDTVRKVLSTQPTDSVLAGVSP